MRCTIDHTIGVHVVDKNQITGHRTIAKRLRPRIESATTIDDTHRVLAILEQHKLKAVDSAFNRLGSAICNGDYRALCH